MVRFILLACAAAAAGCRAPAPASSTPPGPAAAAPVSLPGPVQREMAAALESFQQIIVLLADDDSDSVESPAGLAARILYGQEQEHLEALGELLHQEPARTSFLDALEKDAELHDADKLAFRDLAAELPASARVDDARRVLERIQARYDDEMRRVFGRFETRGMVERRESWDAYVAFLRSRHDRDSILRRFDAELQAVGGDARGSGPSRDDGSHITGRRLPEKTVVLTFDDGPHPRFTPAIVELLRRYGVKGVFFEVGKNVAGKLSPTSASAAAAGHTLGNHTYSHAFLPKLSASEVTSQIVQTNDVLRPLVHGEPMLFRPPYGAMNAGVQSVTTGRSLRTVMWNVDSLDWADPVPSSIANRVIKQVQRQKRGVILFHDIHERTVQTLPLVLEELTQQGYTFLAWNGREFAAEGRAAPAVATAAAAAAAPLYRDSWAVVIGINQYKSWPRLSYAVNDARAVRDLLVRRYDFKPEKIFTLLDGEATRDRILSVLGDRLADAKKVGHEDRVVIFFAGHGVTRRLPNGRSLGYIVPADADTQNYQSQAISMTSFQDISEAIPAKHVLFVMDACYSGLALTRGAGAVGGDRRQYLREVTRRSARQMLTAGGADEQVADGGPSGHSIFTWTLLQGLDGRADLDGDGVVTATELAAFVGPGVSSLSHQTPAFGSLPGSEGGEVVFELSHDNEYLSEDSKQLDAQAIALNQELERLRKDLEAKQARNEQLQKELASAQAQLKTAAAGTAAPAAPAPAGIVPAEQARKEVDRGIGLFREKRYPEAAAAFESALRLNPSNALAANNLAFAYFKLGRMDDAIAWYGKTIALDPRRAIAHANLGDAYAALGRRDEALQEYRRFLELQPQSKVAPSVKAKLDELNAAPAASPAPKAP